MTGGLWTAALISFCTALLRENGHVQLCGNHRGTLRLRCPAGRVLSNISAVAGVSDTGRCEKTSADCQGVQSTVLVTSNNCYWKRSCDLTLDENIPIMASPMASCVGRRPTYLMVPSCVCKPEDELFTVCSGTYHNISAKSGLLRSHRKYPWHYTAKDDTSCAKQFDIPPGHGLRVWTQQMDIDSHHDSLQFWQLTSVSRDIIADPFRVLTGTVQIRFKISSNTRGATGFLLNFSVGPVSELKKFTTGSEEWCDARALTNRSQRRKEKRKKHRKSKKRKCRRKKKKNRRKQRQKLVFASSL